VRQGRVDGKSKGEQIWSMYSVFVYENRTMKSAKIVLRRGHGDEG
jgi:hypothetical protein